MIETAEELMRKQKRMLSEPRALSWNVVPGKLRRALGTPEEIEQLLMNVRAMFSIIACLRKLITTS